MTNTEGMSNPAPKGMDPIVIGLTNGAVIKNEDGVITVNGIVTDLTKYPNVEFVHVPDEVVE